MFEEFWEQGLLAYDELNGIVWSWLSMDGAITKALLGGKRWVPPPPIAVSAGPSEACWPEPREFRGAWGDVHGTNRDGCKLVESTLDSIPIRRSQTNTSTPNTWFLDKD